MCGVLDSFTDYPHGLPIFVLFCFVCLFVCHQIVINKQKMRRVKGLPHNSQPVSLLP